MTLWRVTTSWRAWRTDGGERRPIRGGWRASEELDLDGLPGRWDHRRQLPEELAPLPLVAGEALERAGWLTRGRRELVGGGLIVCSDGLPIASGLGFAREVMTRLSSNIAPSRFLFALPSTAASVLGLLFGLTEYQATLDGGPLGGVRALGHGLDLLATGRVDRVLVAVLSVLGGPVRDALGEMAAGDEKPPDEARLAVAFAIERGGDALPAAGGGLKTVRLGLGRGRNGRSDAPSSPAEEPSLTPPRRAPLPAICRFAAASPLQELASIIESSEARGRTFRILQKSPWSPDTVWIDIMEEPPR